MFQVRTYFPARAARHIAPPPDDDDDDDDDDDAPTGEEAGKTKKRRKRPNRKEITHTIAGPATPLNATAAHATPALISPLATGRNGLFSTSMSLSNIWLIPTMNAFPSSSAVMPITARGRSAPQSNAAPGASRSARAVPAIDARTVPRMVCGRVNLYSARSLAPMEPFSTSSLDLSMAAGSKSPSTAIGRDVAVVVVVVVGRCGAVVVWRRWRGGCKGDADEGDDDSDFDGMPANLIALVGSVHRRDDDENDDRDGGYDEDKASATGGVFGTTATSTTTTNAAAGMTHRDDDIIIIPSGRKIRSMDGEFLEGEEVISGPSSFCVRCWCCIVIEKIEVLHWFVCC